MTVTRLGTYGQIRGTSYKLPCKLATTGAITLSGTQTIDGVAAVVNDRVLVWQQATASTNGIYVVSNSTWSRAIDMSVSTNEDYTANDLFTGIRIYITTGSTYADKVFVLKTPDPIILNTTDLTFQVSSTATGDFVTNVNDTWTGTGKITDIATLTQAEYNAIGVKNPNMLYVII